MANQPKKYRKFVVGAASAALVATAVAPVAASAAESKFTDISGYAQVTQDQINTLVNEGIITGTSATTFAPAQHITRGQVVKLLGRYLVESGYAKVPTDWNSKERFSDVAVDFKDADLVKNAAVVFDAGVFKGNDGVLNSGGQITRENMALVLDRAAQAITGTSLQGFAVGLPNTVNDLNKAKSEAHGAIQALNALGLSNVDAFRPKENVQRVHFATLLSNAIDLINDKVHADVESVTAINSTTVEVTYKEEIADVKSINFKIEGLTVVDAVVKQTDKKTAVLTTSKQEGDKTYTVTAGDDVLGQFKGISDVVPTAIEVTTPTVQGTIGKEVTVHAKVTVPEGQSKAGIPVTFNIVNDRDNLNKTIEIETKTNADGVASHSYTRYYEHNDSVTAYATEKSSVFSKGKVYWASALSITEVTAGNTLANGAKKVYKINASSWNTQYTSPTSNVVDYNYVNVAFAENVDVAPDKVVRGAKIEDTGVAGNDAYPSQVTTGGVQKVRVKVDAKGEATFTVTGTNASLTPVVFVDNSTGLKDKWTVDALQAAAPTLKFDLAHTLGLNVKAEGVQNAAARNAEGTGNGGREYTVTVTGKDGKVAPEGSSAFVVFQKDSISKDKAVYIDGSAARVVVDTVYNITVGKDGKATFTLTGAKDAFATPTVFLDNGESTGAAKLDADDLQTVGEITYFVNAVVKDAKLEVIDPTTGKEVTTLPSSKIAQFNYNSVDQNGFDYYAGTGIYEVSYEVTAEFADVTVSGVGLASTLVKKGTTETVKVKSALGHSSLIVNSSNVASNVTVNASASQVSLPNKSASISFSKGTELPVIHTGFVTNLDEVNEKIKFDAFDAISYNGGTYTNVLNQPISKAQFVASLNSVSSTNKAQVTAIKQADGKYSFNILSLSTPKTAAEQLATAQAKLVAVQEEAEALVKATYTPASWLAYTGAKATADSMTEVDATEVDAKTAAIKAAMNLLVLQSAVDAVEQAAILKLATAKAADVALVQADYTATSWATFATARTAFNLLGEATVNQKNAKANAIDAAIAALSLKLSQGVLTVAVDETDVATGGLEFTFTEATVTTNLAIDTIVNAKSSTIGETLAVTVSATPDNVLSIKVVDAASADVDLSSTLTGVYTFEATIKVTTPTGDYTDQDVTVTVTHDGTDWVATVNTP